MDGMRSEPTRNAKSIEIWKLMMIVRPRIEVAEESHHPIRVTTDAA